MSYHSIRLERPLDPVSKIGIAANTDSLFFFGGQSETSYLDAFNIYNLRENRWEEMAELSSSQRPSPRSGHLFSYLNPSYLIVFGGVSQDGLLGDTYLFNLVTYSWEKLSLLKKTPSPRHGMAWTVHKDVVYMLAGYGEQERGQGPINELWTFDPRSRTWRSLYTLGEEKPTGIGFTAIVDHNRIIAVGERILNIYVLDFSSREWRKIRATGGFKDRIEGPCICQTSSNSLHMLGGKLLNRITNDVYALDFSEDQFVWHKLDTTGNKPTPRYMHSAIALGEIVLLVGGQDDSCHFDDVYAFNPSLGLRWLCLRTSGDPPSARVGHFMCMIPSTNSIFVHGGDSHGKVMSDAYYYRCESKEWEPIHTKNESPALAYHTGVYYPNTNSIILYGGGNLVTCSDKVFSLSLDKLTWKQIKIKKNVSPRAGHCALLYENRMLVIGGFIPNEGYSIDVLTLSLSDFHWKKMKIQAPDGRMPPGRIAMTCSLISNNTVIMIGGVNTTVVLDDLWRLDLASKEWKRLSVPGLNPGAMYGHVANIVENQVFIFAGDVYAKDGTFLTVPTDCTTWCLDIYEDEFSWHRTKVEGKIPPKRYQGACVYTNDIIVFGGGDDQNIYQLDRNDIGPSALSGNLFADFVEPYQNIAMPNLVKPEKKKKLIEGSSIKDTSSYRSPSSVSSGRSYRTDDTIGFSKRAEELMKKAKEYALVRKRMN